MDNSQHTPGPWKARKRFRAGLYSVVPVYGTDEAGGLHLICWLHTTAVPGAQLKANTRLIEAAPTMLTALQMLYAETDDYQRLNKLGGHDNQCMRLARAALAAATGSTHE